MSTSFPAVSEGTSICQCDALSTGANSITQCPASLSLSATLLAPTLAYIHISSQQRLEHTHRHMVSCRAKHVGYTKMSPPPPGVYLSLCCFFTHSPAALWFAHRQTHTPLPHTLPLFNKSSSKPLSLSLSTFPGLTLMAAQALRAFLQLLVWLSI